MKIKTFRTETAPENWSNDQHITETIGLWQEEVGCEKESLQLKRYIGTNLCQLFFLDWEGWRPVGDLLEFEE